MTTNASTIKNPYDAEIVAEKATRTSTLYFEWLLGCQEGYRSGFTDAKAEDAPLLEALMALVGANDALAPLENDHRWELARAAITAATGKE